MVVDIPDKVTYTNFGDHPIDFHRRPYNTLALPCERVMRKCSVLLTLRVQPTATKQT